MRSLGEGSRTCHIMPIEALKTATSSPPPLRKTNLQQQVYTRPRGIEDKLKESESQPEETTSHKSLSKEEWIAEFNKWVDSHRTDTPLLSDEDLRRENIYEDRF